MSYVPEFVALYEIIPFIEYLPLNNATIRVAVEIYYNFSCLEYIEYEEDEITYNAYKVVIMKYGEIEEWNTSQVTDMSTLFCDLDYFNPPIGKWDTSNVTNMSSMFEYAKHFNQPIGGWNTSSVTDMNFMFQQTEDFNQYIGDWDVSKVTTMDFMFEDAESFNLENAPWYHE